MPMLQKHSLASIETTRYDLDPADVIGGDPKPGATIFWTSADGTSSAGLFTSTPGKFTVRTGGSESTLVTKGRIIVTAADGTEHEYGVGDVMTFEAGARSTFTVLEDYEDYFVVNNPPKND